jgi:hypothetical protein
MQGLPATNRSFKTRPHPGLNGTADCAVFMDLKPRLGLNGTADCAVFMDLKTELALKMTEVVL